MRAVLVAGVVKVTAAGCGRLCWLWEVLRVALAVLNCWWGLRELRWMWELCCDLFTYFGGTLGFRYLYYKMVFITVIEMRGILFVCLKSKTTLHLCTFPDRKIVLMRLKFAGCGSVATRSN